MRRPPSIHPATSRWRHLEKRNSSHACDVATLFIVISGDLSLDPGTRTFRREAEEVKLTSAECDVLNQFLASTGKILSRETLVETVLERRFSPFDRSMDLRISNLRRKLARGRAVQSGSA